MTPVPRRRTTARTSILLFFLSAAIPLAAQQLPALPTSPFSIPQNDSRACLKCHGMATFAVRDSVTLKVRDLSVHADRFNSSVHRNIRCQQCHDGMTSYPHAASALKRRVSCGDDCHTTDSTGRPYNHARISDELAASVHGVGLKARSADAPSCMSCHGSGKAHEVRKAAKSVSPATKMELCVKCHDDAEMMRRNRSNTEAVSTYKRSFHYKAIHFGATGTAVCQDCHTVHGVLPKDSVRSSISSANISRTCGQKACHPGAAMNFSMSGFNHLGLRIEREPILLWIERFFIVLTAGSMAMLLVGIVLDIQRKFGWGRLALRGYRGLGRVWIGAAQPARVVVRTARKLLID